jgi:hypothetical protein
MVGSYSFEGHGEKNPYDEHRMYAGIATSTEDYMREQREAGTATDTIFRMYTATAKYFSDKETSGKEVERANFSANFNTFYTTSNTTAEHYAIFFHLLWASGYATQDIEGFANAQASYGAEENPDNFIEVANEGMQLFLKELQG